ncbi:SCO family protein [Hymenobacter sp.]|uniref:SCO family protein n=1 Tax=Hymenobacter sp. TaxID=1898978 RepID=UPI002869FA4B|nr:SCO family protein [Hymenobacter sp.]
MNKPSNRGRAVASRQGDRFIKTVLLAGVTGLWLGGCSGPAGETKSMPRLPYLGERLVQPRPGRAPDTVVAQIPSFALQNQYGQPVTRASLAGRVYVADFFFATCPNICPRMQSQLQRVFQRYRHDSRVALLSHTIDPAHDSLPVLRAYAARLGVREGQPWHFVMAPRDTIFQLARAYATVAESGGDLPGRLAHGGTLALVDGRGYLRGLYDGLVPAETDRLLLDVARLLAEAPAEASLSLVTTQKPPPDL